MDKESTMVGRRERKREQTRQGLITAAIELFIAKGFDETTIDDIAAAADLAKVTFYYYFKSKEEIVLAIKESCVQEILANSEKLLDEDIPAPEVLHVFVKDIGRWTEKNWQLLTVFAAQRFGPMMKGETCASKEKALPMVQLIKRILVSGQNSGHFRSDIVPDEIAHFFLLAIMNAQFSWIHESRKKSELTAKLDHCIDFVINGIAQRQ